MSYRKDYSSIGWLAAGALALLGMLADAQVPEFYVIGGGRRDAGTRSYAENGTFLPAPSAVGVNAIAMGAGAVAAGTATTVGGGANNTIGATADHGTIGGGSNNTIETGSPGSAIGGGNVNSIWSGSIGATIAGGEGNAVNTSYGSVGGGKNNLARDDSAFGGALVAGGMQNRARGPCATVGGGYQNTADNSSAVVAGGNNNEATANYATVPGGHMNSASGEYTLAAGRRAKATTQGSFVWGDSADADVAPYQDNQFIVRCNGGVVFRNTDGLQFAGWVPGQSSWTFPSDRNLKENIEPADTRAVLEKVTALPISEWNYTGYQQRHIGPMAQDFHAAFPLNDNSKAIDSGDLPGIALAAIQELAKQNAELRAELEAVKLQLKNMAK